MSRPHNLAATIGIVDAYIVEAAARGDGAGLLPLRRKLRALIENPPPPSTSRELRQARIELERDSWIEAIEILLLPDVREDLVDALADGDGGRCDDTRHCHGGPRCDGPWAELDPRARRARDRSAKAELIRAQRIVIEACRRYAHTRKTGHLRAAVRDLEEAVRSDRARDSWGLEPGSLREEAERLERALAAALPPREEDFFLGHVEPAIAKAIEQEHPLRRSDRHGASLQPLSRSDRADAGDALLGPETPCFVDGLQERFDREREQERHRENAAGRRRSRIQPEDGAWESLGQEEMEPAQAEPDDVDRGDGADVEATTRAASAPVERQRTPGGLTAEQLRAFPKDVVRNAEMMSPAMAEAVTAELQRQGRWDALLAQRQADHDEYDRQLRGR